MTSGPNLGGGFLLSLIAMVRVIQAFHNKKWLNLAELDIYVYKHIYMYVDLR